MVKSGLADDLGTHTHVKTGKQHIMKIQRIVWSGLIVWSGFDFYMVHKNTTMGYILHEIYWRQFKITLYLSKIERNSITIDENKSKQSRKGMPNIRLFFNFHSENFQQLTILSHYARSYLHSRTKKNIFLLRKHGTIIFERESACICITTYCMIKLSVKNFWVSVPLYLYVKRQACAHLELTWRFQTYEYMLVNSL